MLMIQNSFDANPPKFIKVFDVHYLLATLCPDGFGSGGLEGDVIADGVPSQVIADDAFIVHGITFDRPLLKAGQRVHLSGQFKIK